MTIAIKVGARLSELTGYGEELLVINGEIIARFFDGSLVRISEHGTEKTLVPNESEF